MLFRSLDEIGAAALPRAVVLNKVDRSGFFRVERIKAQLRRDGLPVCALSALTGEGVENLWGVFDWLAVRRS